MRTRAVEQGNEDLGLSELIQALQSALPASSQCATPISTSPRLHKPSPAMTNCLNLDWLQLLERCILTLI